MTTARGQPFPPPSSYHALTCRHPYYTIGGFPNMPQAITEGRIVHYVVSCLLTNTNKCRPGLIVNASPNPEEPSEANLVVFLDGHNDAIAETGGTSLNSSPGLMRWQEAASYNDDRSLGSWHWPTDSHEAPAAGSNSASSHPHAALIPSTDSELGALGTQL